MLVALEHEAIRQAVRLGEARVSTAHLLLAVVELDEQLNAVGLRLPEPLQSVNCGGRILAKHSIGAQVLAQMLPGLADGDEQTASLSQRRRWWRENPRHPAWTGSAAKAADQAQMNGVGTQVGPGSGHLLLASLAVPEGAAATLLRTLQVEPRTIVSEVMRLLPDKP